MQLEYPHYQERYEQHHNYRSYRVPQPCPGIRIMTPHRPRLDL